MNKLELKPCPFCGGSNLDISNKTTTSSWKRKRHVSVYCKDCNTYGPRYLTEETNFPEFCTDEAKETAMIMWNRRDTP